jgi:hypothetical protein
VPTVGAIEPKAGIIIAVNAISAINALEERKASLKVADNK